LLPQENRKGKTSWAKFERKWEGKWMVENRQVGREKQEGNWVKSGRGSG
jgi:hypothetical protein